jgi:hypothetical protein
MLCPYVVRSVDVEADLADGACNRTSIHDSEPSRSAGQQQHLCGAFYTTKEDETGPGLARRDAPFGGDGSKKAPPIMTINSGSQ